MLRKVSTSCNPSASVLDDCALQLSREQCLLLYWTSLSCCTSATSLITQDYLSRPTYLKGHQPIDSPDAPPPDAPPQTHHLQTHHLRRTTSRPTSRATTSRATTSSYLKVLLGRSRFPCLSSQWHSYTTWNWSARHCLAQHRATVLHSTICMPLPCTAPCHCLAQHYLHATALHSTVSLPCTALSAASCTTASSERTITSCNRAVLTVCAA